MIREIPRSELRRRRLSGEAVLVVDVRSPEEHAAGAIEGSMNVPLAEIEADPAHIQAAGLVVTVCGKGGGRSARAAEVLAEAGTAEVGFLEGGTLGWLADADTQMGESWPGTCSS